MHPRISIRRAIKDLLIAGGTDAGNRVFAGRVDPVFQAQLPAILIYSTEEEINRDIVKAGRRLRTVQTVVKAVVQAGAGSEDSFQDTLDALVEQIEGIIDADERLSQTCETVWFDRTDFTLSGEGENLLAVANLTYSIEYRG